MEDALRPRLCFLTKADDGYGFHLHGQRNKGGQFIRKVEPGSSADLAGLRAGDRVVEVNGENVENETHHQVVSRIREVPHRTRMLVVDKDTDDYLCSRGLACTEDMAVEMGTLSLRAPSRPALSTTRINAGNLLLSPKRTHASSFQAPGPESPVHVMIRDKGERSLVASSTATDPELQVEASPEPPAELLPRLCHLVKGEQSYGFNLHNDKTNGGQFIQSVDPGSPAESADIRPGDRLVEVNGVNIDGLRHSEVVALIRAGGEEVRLLVVDQETDEFFHRVGTPPSTSHVKEVYVNGSATGRARPTPSPTTDIPTVNPPTINITLSDSPTLYPPSKSRGTGSSASQSSRGSTTLSDISSDMSIHLREATDEDDTRVSDSAMDSSLRLSPTAAEAKQKVHAHRWKKRAPPMDWSKKQEIFSNF